MAFFYAVTATLPDEATAAEYLDWLGHGHTQQVVAAGASSARIVRLDGDPGGTPRIETQYVFPDRAAFDRYVSTAAPGLRAEGLARFPPSRGITMVRRSGEIQPFSSRPSPGTVA
jgi:hypothetical protein